MVEKILYTRNFRKHFAKRIIPYRSLAKIFDRRLKLFLSNPQHPILRDHQLSGTKKRFRAFSIGGDHRVIYQKTDDVSIFMDIGAHNQVY